jgi:aconitate hydratase
VPLTFSDPQHWKAFEQGDFLRFSDLKAQLQHADSVEVINRRTEQKYRLLHHMSSRQIQTILAGGLICLIRQALRLRDVS